jgi:hypothetical protein
MPFNEIEELVLNLMHTIVPSKGSIAGSERHCHFNSDTNNSGFVVNHNEFLHVGKEQVCIFNMGRMSYILCNTFGTLEGRFKDMSEALIQVFNA